MHASTVSAPINEEVEIKEEQIEHENNGTDNLDGIKNWSNTRASGK